MTHGVVVRHGALTGPEPCDWDRVRAACPPVHYLMLPNIERKSSKRERSISISHM